MKILDKSQQDVPGNIKVNFNNMNEAFLRGYYADEMQVYDEIISRLPYVLRDINDRGNDLNALVDVWFATGRGVAISVVIYGFDIEDSFDPYLTVLENSMDTQFLATINGCINADFVSRMDAKYTFGTKTIKTGPYMFFRYMF